MRTLDDNAASGLGRFRRLLLILLTVGMIGTGAELLLLDHDEDLWQLAPIVLIVLGLGAVAWEALRSGSGSVAALRTVMVLFVATGAAGIAVHSSSNSEFQREMDPELAGWPLVVKVMKAKAPPALAPAILIQLGLLGLLSTYRHPAVSPAVRDELQETSGAS